MMFIVLAYSNKWNAELAICWVFPNTCTLWWWTESIP